MDIFRKELTPKTSEKVSEAGGAYKVFCGGKKLVIPKCLVKKMISKDTGFAFKKEVVNAIIRVMDDPKHKVDFGLKMVYEYSLWLKKSVGGCKYTSKLKIDVLPDSNKVTFMSVKNWGTFCMGK